MYKYVLLLLSCFVLVACNETTPQNEVIIIPEPTVAPSPSPTPSPTSDIPQEFKPYVDKFIADGFIQGVDVTKNTINPKLTVKRGNLDSYGSSIIGLCERTRTMRRVTIDPDFWDKVSTTQKELLMHHELGHCVLYRPHRSDILQDNTYASIMYPIIMKSSWYTNKYNYYQNELFTWEGLSDKETEIHACPIDEINDME